MVLSHFEWVTQTSPSFSFFCHPRVLVSGIKTFGDDIFFVYFNLPTQNEKEPIKYYTPPPLTVYSLTIDKKGISYTI